VAIKCLSPQRIQDRHHIIRFRHEARGMASLSHDNILAVFDYAYQHGAYYIVMEYIEGTTYEQLRAAGIPLFSKLHVLERIARALGYAHGEGVIHRDVKPGNILLGRQGQIKLADFGLAAFDSGMSFHSSMAGSPIGTLAYMAPESLVSPDDIDARVDVYALGCILYETLFARLPFDGATIADMSYRILNEQPAAPHGSEGDAGLGELALRCLAKDRAERPPLDEVTGALWRAVHAKLDDAQARLVACIQQRPVSPTGLPHTAVQTRPPATARRAHGRLRTAGALAIVAIIALAVALWLVVGRRANTPDSLPALTPLQTGPAAPSVPARSGQAAVAATDGPSPVIDTDENFATVILSGLSPADTILVNGKPISMRIRRSTIGVPVAPGRNRLVVRRASGASVSRAIDAMPFQTIEWNAGEDFADAAIDRRKNQQR
jgi:serine/threonine-protein kinase